MPLSKAEKITRDCSYSATDGNIAAIDFGTTSVSLAYTTKAAGFENVNALPLEPAAAGDQATRVLSAILLRKNEAEVKVAAFGRLARRKFSLLKSTDYENHTMIYFERIKMRLRREQNINRQSLVTSFSGEQYYLVEVIAFILKYLKDQLIDHLSRTARPLVATDFDWVITVPAMWDARRKRMMREAAYMAGLLDGSDGICQFTPTDGHSLSMPNEINFSRLTLALEPESAAIYCQKKMQDESKSDPSAITSKPSTRYMVIDIGGSTVDISTEAEVDGAIIVENISTDNWGGITEAFSHLLQEFVSDKGFEKYLSSGIKAKQMAILNFILYREFEDQIVLFGQGQTDAIVITLSDLFQFYEKEAHPNEKVMKGISKEGDALYLDKEVVESQLFDPALDAIIKCILSAIKVNDIHIDAFYLVGGFGGCKYVYEKVKHAIKRHHNSEAHVIVPLSSQLAVAIGAVMWRKDPKKIKARRSDATYGIGIAMPFDPQHHDDYYKYRDYEDESILDWCASVFHVFLEKGDLVYENEVFVASGIPTSRNDTQIPIKIYSTINPDVQYIDDKQGESLVSEIGQLVIEVPNPNNLPNHERIVDVTIDFSSTEIQAKAKYRVNGEEVKTVCDFLSAKK